jgi:hypothetical protein
VKAEEEEAGRARSRTAERDSREQTLDDALAESFPASDPPAMLRRRDDGGERAS